VKRAHPFALSLSKCSSFFEAPEKEERGFDRLSPNGIAE
jgi:hypothetical protein